MSVLIGERNMSSLSNIYMFIFYNDMNKKILVLFSSFAVFFMIVIYCIKNSFHINFSHEFQYPHVNFLHNSFTFMLYISR